MKKSFKLQYQLLCELEVDQGKIKLMRFSCYDWNPKRFHPEFTGIASRYSEHKKERVAKQKQRKELESDHAYTLNLDRSLDKAVESKALELFKLQQTKQRHFEDIRYKQQLYEERRQQIQSLREKNIHIRMQNKKNIQRARNILHSRNEHSRVKMQQNLLNLNHKHSKFMQRQLQTNHMKRLEVQGEEFDATMKVNNFYRQKNEQSLNLYLQRIKEEDLKKKQEQKQIKRFEKHIKAMNKTVETKREFLNQVQAQIYKLRTNIKTLSNGTKIRRKTVKEDTEGSEGEKKVQEWKTSLKKLMNPEDYRDLI